MKTFYNLILGIAFVFFLVSSSFAAYPIASHKADTQGHHQKVVSFNYSFEYEKADEGGEIARTNEMDTILSYGVHENIDLIMGLPFDYRTFSDRKDEESIGDISFEAKWKFYDQNYLTMALYPEVTLPTGAYKRGIGNGRATFAATLIFTKTIHPFSFHLSGQYTRNENKKGDAVDLFEVHFSPECKVAKRLTLVADISLEKDKDKANHKIPLYLNCGINYSFNETFSINPAVKFGFTSTTTEEDVIFLLGNTLTF